MEHITNLINTASLSVKREEKESNLMLDPHATDIVNKIFVFFYSICRGFEKQYQDPKKLNAEKTQWIRAFMDVGFNTQAQIQRGIEKCRLESPINTPTIGQFLKWCAPTAEELGVPCVEDAYAEACYNSSSANPEKKWTHPATYNAWTKCNSYELAHLPKKNTYPIFERNYAMAVKMLISGHTLKALPSPSADEKEAAPKEGPEKEFKHCNSREAAMTAMSKMLGKNINGRIDQGRMQKDLKQDRI